MKAYRGSRDIAPLVLNLCTRWWWVVSYVPHPLPTGKDPSLYIALGLNGPRSWSWHCGKGKQFLALNPTLSL